MAEAAPQSDVKGRLFPVCAEFIPDLVQVVAAEADPVAQRCPMAFAAAALRVFPESRAKMLKRRAPEVADKPLDFLRSHEFRIREIAGLGQRDYDVTAEVVCGPVPDELAEKVQELVQLANGDGAMWAFLAPPS